MNDKNKEPEDQQHDIWDSVEDIAKKIIKVIIRIVKGEKDVVTLLSQGYNAVTHVNGALSVPQDLTPIGDFNEITIAFDNDDTGRMASEKLARHINEEFPSINIKIAQWDEKLPKGYDITDLFTEIK